MATATVLSSCYDSSTPNDPVTANPINSTTFSELLATHALYAEDDFNGPVNTPPNSRFWNIQFGSTWGGAHESQTYTTDPRNIRQDGLGNLVLEADDTAGHITSARIDTEGKLELTDGLIAARIKVPGGQGLHSAFWMLGRSIRTVGWPACGEIDIAEILNDGLTAYFTIHGPADDPRQLGPDGDVQVQSTKISTDFVDNFHTYWLFKQPQKLIVGIDDKQVAAFSPGHLRQSWRWVYDGPFFAVLNLAVGGDWPGPLAPGVLPKQMVVDWIRFYK